MQYSSIPVNRRSNTFNSTYAPSCYFKYDNNNPAHLPDAPKGGIKRPSKIMSWIGCNLHSTVDKLLQDFILPNRATQNKTDAFFLNRGDDQGRNIIIPTFHLATPFTIGGDGRLLSSIGTQLPCFVHESQSLYLLPASASKVSPYPQSEIFTLDEDFFRFRKLRDGRRGGGGLFPLYIMVCLVYIGGQLHTPVATA